MEVQPSELLERFINIMQTEFISRMCGQAAVAIAVSGGPDSMALCSLLSRWGAHQNLDIKLHAFTVNHQLRPESGAEAQRVSEWLAPFSNIKHSILVWEHDRKLENRIQESARAARYFLLADSMKKHNISNLFLGHHQDDQAETFLFRLAKGSGLDGLAGMGAYQEFETGLFLCRPMLSFSKEEILGYCDSHNIPYCKDPSNEADRFARVRLRQSVSILEAEGLSNKRLAITAQRIGRARKALEEMAQKAFQESLLVQETNQFVFKFSIWSDLPEEIGLRVLLMAINCLTEKDGYGPRMERVENLFSDLMKPQPFRKRTLSGVVFERMDSDDKVILRPEG